MVSLQTHRQKTMARNQKANEPGKKEKNKQKEQAQKSSQMSWTVIVAM